MGEVAARMPNRNRRLVFFLAVVAALLALAILAGLVPTLAQTAQTPSTHPGLGAIPYPGGTAFRTWAPHADAVSVIGDFNGWNPGASPLAREAGGWWSADVPGARVGDEFRYFIRRGDVTHLQAARGGGHQPLRVEGGQVIGGCFPRQALPQHRLEHIGSAGVIRLPGQGAEQVRGAAAPQVAQRHGRARQFTGWHAQQRRGGTRLQGDRQARHAAAKPHQGRRGRRPQHLQRMPPGGRVTQVDDQAHGAIRHHALHHLLPRGERFPVHEDVRQVRPQLRAYRHGLQRAPRRAGLRALQRVFVKTDEQARVHGLHLQARPASSIRPSAGTP